MRKDPADQPLFGSPTIGRLSVWYTLGAFQDVVDHWRVPHARNQLSLARSRHEKPRGRNPVLTSPSFISQLSNLMVAVYYKEFPSAVPYILHCCSAA
jgi:hypothetical protein